MTIIKHANNFATTLNGDITNVATSITLTSATGLPSIGSNEAYYLTITDGSNVEIVLVTDDASSPTLTVTRGQQGTSGTAFSDGDTIELRATADSFDRKQDQTATAGEDIDFSAADSFKVPSNSSPILDGDGEFAYDTTVTGFSHGLPKGYSGEEFGYVVMPIAQFTSPTDGHVPAYNATNDEFELVAQAGGGGSGGAWNFLGAQTASTSASLNFESLIDSIYDTYIFVIEGVRISNGGQSLCLRTSTDNGSTYDSTASDYHDSGMRVATSGTLVGFGTSSGTRIRLSSDLGAQVAADDTVNGQVWMYNANNAATDTMFKFEVVFNHLTGSVCVTGAGKRTAIADVDAVQFLSSSGNLTSGTIRLYGLSKS
jgi:hypothetical protein